MRPDAIVIGASVAGLAAAAYVMRIFDIFGMARRTINVEAGRSCQRSVYRRQRSAKRQFR